MNSQMYVKPSLFDSTDIVQFNFLTCSKKFLPLQLGGVFECGSMYQVLAEEHCGKLL